jgi:hypothetical protein
MTGKEIITEINNENHDCVGQKGTIIMTFSTVSDLILDKNLGIKLKGGKMYGLIFHQQIVNLAIEYLMYLIRLNVSYSVLNTHRSMLMQTVPYFGVASCNKSNLISRVMKGYFIIKPVS